MGDRRSTTRGAALGAATAVLLLGASACGGSDDDGGSAGDGGGNAPRLGSSVIGGWENACAVHDVEAIKEFMGIRAFGVEPGEHAPGGGFSTDVKGCDVAAFDMPMWERPAIAGGMETDDSLSGYMYLRVHNWENEQSFDERSQNAYAALVTDTGDGPAGPRDVIVEGELTGAWDEGSFYLAGTAPASFHTDRVVWAYLRDGDWSVGAEIHYDADPLFWWMDQAEQVYPFTDEELATWISETYLPQVHAAVQDAVATAPADDR